MNSASCFLSNAVIALQKNEDDKLFFKYEEDGLIYLQVNLVVDYGVASSVHQENHNVVQACDAHI